MKVNMYYYYENQHFSICVDLVPIASVIHNTKISHCANSFSVCVCDLPVTIPGSFQLFADCKMEAGSKAED